jgi:hypothetical protein
MKKLEKRALVEASIQGEEVWRVPVSAWGHLLPPWPICGNLIGIF